MAVFATADRSIAVKQYMPWNEADQERYNIAKDFEGTIESALARMQIAFIAILMRRLAYNKS
jgi:hypothetical protein